MPGLNLQGGYGAGGGFDAMMELREAVRREAEDKALQEEAANRLAENARQFNTRMPLDLSRLNIDERLAKLEELKAPVAIKKTEAETADITGRPAHELTLQGNLFANQNKMQTAGFGHDVNMQTNQNLFTGGQNALDRTFKTNERLGSQNFTAGQNTLDRGHEVSLTDITGRQRLAQIMAGGAQDRMTDAAKLGATTGGPAGRQSQRESFLKEAMQTIKQLETMPGFTSAVGSPLESPESLFGLRDEPMAGTDAANFAKYVDTLKSQLVLPRLSVMQGLGPMSEREFGTVQAASTALDRKLSEEQFKKELARLKTSLGVMGTELGLDMSGGAGGGRVRVEGPPGPDGKRPTGTVSAEEAKTLGSGWKIIGG